MYGGGEQKRGRIKEGEAEWAQRQNRVGGRGQENRRREERGWKGLRREWAFVGVDVMALWGMCLQGAKGPRAGGTGVEGG